MRISRDPENRHRKQETSDLNPEALETQHGQFKSEFRALKTQHEHFEPEFRGTQNLSQETVETVEPYSDEKKVCKEEAEEVLDFFKIRVINTP